MNRQKNKIITRNEEGGFAIFSVIFVIVSTEINAMKNAINIRELNLVEIRSAKFEV